MGKRGRGEKKREREREGVERGGKGGERERGEWEKEREREGEGERERALFSNDATLTSDLIEVVMYVENRDTYELANRWAYERGMLRHRPHASNVAVVSVLQNKNGGGTLIF
jgi:hypothetical protein